MDCQNIHAVIRNMVVSGKTVVVVVFLISVSCANKMFSVFGIYLYVLISVDCAMI